MKQIIKSKSYQKAIGFSILAFFIIWISYHILQSEYIIDVKPEGNILFLTLMINIFLFAFTIGELFFYKKGIRGYDVKPIEIYSRFSKILFWGFILIVGITYFTLVFSGELKNYYFFWIIYFSLRAMLFSGIYLNEKYLVIGNKVFELDEIKGVRESWLYNLELFIDQKYIFINAANRKGKSFIMNLINERKKEF